MGWRMENRAIERASVSRGQKRHAEDNLEDEQRFTKRFNLLNLGTIFTIHSLGFRLMLTCGRRTY